MKKEVRKVINKILKDGKAELLHHDTLSVYRYEISFDCKDFVIDEYETVGFFSIS